jgi:hypothetical protein
MLLVSGHGPFREDGSLIKGRVEVGGATQEEAVVAAAHVAFAMLATIKAEVSYPRTNVHVCARVYAYACVVCVHVNLSVCVCVGVNVRLPVGVHSRARACPCTSSQFHVCPTCACVQVMCALASPV